MTTDAILDEVRRTHITNAGQTGWSCTCGAGNSGALTTVNRARAARDQRLRAVVRKASR